MRHLIRSFLLVVLSIDLNANRAELPEFRSLTFYSTHHSKVIRVRKTFGNDLLEKTKMSWEDRKKKKKKTKERKKPHSNFPSVIYEGVEEREGGKRGFEVLKIQTDIEPAGAAKLGKLWHLYILRIDTEFFNISNLSYICVCH